MAIDPDNENVVMVNMIIHHWRENFPKQTAELEKAGQLDDAALNAAERAGRVMEQCQERNMNWGQMQELATEEWGSPPNA